jgi:hypothetical protein
MKYDVFPIRKELEAIQHHIPEINPAAVDGHAPHPADGHRHPRPDF